MSDKKKWQRSTPTNTYKEKSNSAKTQHGEFASVKNDPNTKSVCYFGSNCNKKDKCRYSHPKLNSAQIHGSQIQPSCFQGSSCKRRDSCPYSHPSKQFDSFPTAGGLQQPTSSSVPSASKDIVDFWRQLHIGVSSSKNTNKTSFNIHDAVDRDLWMSCWQAAATGVVGPHPDCHVSLLKCYRNAPNTANAHPAANSVIKVLCGVVTALLKNGERQHPIHNVKPVGNKGVSKVSGTQSITPNAMNTLVCVVDVIRDRLMHPESLHTLSSADIAIVDLAELSKAFSRASLACGLESDQEMMLLARVSNFRDYIGVVKHHGESAAQLILGGDAGLHTPGADPWLGWRDQPTVGWLMSESWHRAVPELRCMYDSEAQYAETLLRVWTLLTFYWGSGAVWPRCMHRQGGGGGTGAGDDAKMCGEPLLADCADRAHEARCTSKIYDKRRNESRTCGNAGAWRCHRHGPGHNVVCSNCLSKEQNKLVAEPGRGASTDIYDAVVDRDHIRRDGSVFLLSGLQSRKPPAIAPNWRTSYRLQSSVLVAVVKLGVSGEPLQRAQALQWAEIVSYHIGPDQHEDQARTQGRIAVRLLSRGDCSALKDEAECPLEPGTRVALIDLRVFVPEVISVLATFANPQFAAQLAHIPFMGRLIGTSKSLQPVTMGPDATIASCVDFAIQNSEIEPVRMLSHAAKLELCAAICKLQPVRSLYGTQLEAFANSLYASIHCTQGPPGTGKSYVGVCLVLALMLIRDAVRKNGSPVGPILMLSYKNHALDEFLVDVLKFSPGGTMSVGKLIRCGTVENPMLLKFSEKHSPVEQKFQRELASRMDNQRLVRKAAAEWQRSGHNLLTQVRWCDAELDTERPFLQFSKEDIQSWVLSLHRAVRLLTKLQQLGDDLLVVGAVRSPEQTHRVLLHIDNDQDMTVDGCRSVLGHWLASTEHWVQLPNVFAATTNNQVDVRVLNWLHVWLQGLHPPLRCLFAKEDAAVPQCMRVAGSTSSFCLQEHACMSTSCPLVRVDGGVQFCEQHMCHALPGVGPKGRPAPCPSENLGGVSEFCAEHTCSGCLSEGCLPPAMKAGPHACGMHQCNSAQCDKLKLFPHMRCEDHTCMECIATGTVSDYQCNPQRPFCPTHRCSAKDCRDIRDVDSLLCNRHTCRECDKCVDMTIERAVLCADHRCAHPLSVCRMQRVEGGASTEYCADHTCKVCTVEKLTQIGPVTDKAPRNCCALHPLCQTVMAKGAQCASLAVPPSVYCATHKPVHKVNGVGNSASGSNSVQKQSPFTKLDGVCCGVTKKGNRCTNKEKTGSKGEYFFCPDHIRQKVEVQKTSSSATASQGPAALTLGVGGSARSVIPTNWDSDDDEEEDEVAQEDPAEVAGEWSDDDEDVFQDAREDFNCADDQQKYSSDEMSTSSGRRFKVVQCSGQLRRDLRCGVKLVVDVDCVFGMCVAHSGDLQQPPRDEIEQPVVMCVEISASSSCLSSSSKPDERAVKKRRNKAPAKHSAAVTGLIDDGDDDYDLLESVDEGRVVDIDVTLDPDERDEEMVAAIVDPEDVAVVHFADVADDGGVDEAVNDEQLRRREIGADDVFSDDDEEEDTYEDDIQLEEEEGEEEREPSVEAAREMASALNWTTPLKDRLVQAARFTRCMGVVAGKLRAEAEEYVMAARREKAEASSAALKSANVVGATVVGASRRLEAIRAAEPFAVVVEEACEVMEPTLISVLAVSSLRKLELVGDHRQLPAFIQQCWFNLESALPSIKTSLFERLISGAVASHRRRKQRGHEDVAGEQLSCTVLDEQRRMRSSIADITRPDYEDVITVTDHPQTALQRIGDQTKSSALTVLESHRSLWPDKGRNVPGVRSNIFFWNLKDHKESRPQAGLSACNELEAGAITELVKFLMLNGVPAGGISVITPYKGQKNLIIKTLRKEHCLPGFNRDKPPPAGSSVMVSTVDRYQGDENDIVILSLVRSRPGNRFVALLNRFIVAVSRARLGFYIVGSVEAVTKSVHGGEGPAHWNRFVESLSQPPSDPKEISCGFDGPRVGNKLPICCPRHMNEKSFCEVTTPKDFPRPTKDGLWKAFCNEGCTHKMSCGHICGLTCHSPAEVPHLIKCTEVVQRPCEAHSLVPLLCANVKKRPHETADMALAHFDCEVQVSHQREECDHVERVDCHVHMKLVAGTTQLRPCIEIVGDFVKPCSHVIKAPKCHVKRSYSVAPPVCVELVNHTRPCGCEKLMVCSQATSEKLEPVQCKTDRTEPRPRCGHRMSAECHVFAQLNELWAAQTGMKADAVVRGGRAVMVEHDVDYGPSESLLAPRLRVKECTVGVDYVAECGHTQKDVACVKAFQYASGLFTAPKCTTKVAVNCPLCLTCELRVPCWAAQQINEWLPWVDVDNQLLPRAGADGRAIIFEKGLTVCGATMPSAEVWQEINNLCTRKVAVQRDCNDNHSVEYRCWQLLSVALRQRSLKRCTQVVERALVCGHSAKVECHARVMEPAPPCNALTNEMFNYPCGKHSVSPRLCVELQKLRETVDIKCCTEVSCELFRCGHSVKVPCHAEGGVRAKTAGARPMDSLVVHDEIYCNSAAAAPTCRHPMSFQHTCGHVLHKVKCCDAFDWAADPHKAPRCVELVDVNHPICGHEIRTQCWVAAAVFQWDPWTAVNGVPPQFEFESHLGDHGEAVQTVVLRNDSPRPAALPVGLKHEHLACLQPAMLVRDCGHTVHSSCSVAFLSQPGLCREIEVTRCDSCGCAHAQECHQIKAQKASNAPPRCSNIVAKKCGVCKINDVNVECFRSNVECHAQAHVEMDCGHVASWICGQNADPRLSADTLCGQCVMPQWDTALEKMLSKEDFVAFDTSALNGANALIPEFYERLVTRAVHADLRYHHEARMYMHRIQSDLMHNGTMQVTAAPGQFGTDLDSSYNFVFVGMSELQGSNVRQQNLISNVTNKNLLPIVSNYFSQLKETPYGRGVTVTPLTAENLRKVPLNANGTVTVCIGAAHCAKELAGVGSFALTNNCKGRQRANRTASQYAQSGYSHVSFTRPDGVEAQVYWIANAVVPLLLLELKLPEICTVCTDPFAKAEGFCCANGHFMCWETCFDGYVQSASAPGAIQGYCDAAGNLLCPEPKCKLPYNLQRVAIGGPSHVFQALMDLQSAVRSTREVSTALEAQQRQLTAEFARIQAMTNLDERDAHMLRREIVDTVLTLRCPRCKTAFVDFDGCFALSCGVNQCKAGFCAWCLSDCGSDAHSHVLQCPENKGRSYYGTEAQFTAHHRERRKLLIQQLLTRQTPEVQRFAKLIMQKDLHDLGIHL